jgi:hypothetical protein
MTYKIFDDMFNNQWYRDSKSQYLKYCHFIESKFVIGIQWFTYSVPSSSKGEQCLNQSTIDILLWCVNECPSIKKWVCCRSNEQKPSQTQVVPKQPENMNEWMNNNLQHNYTKWILNNLSIRGNYVLQDASWYNPILLARHPTYDQRFMWMLSWLNL